MKFICKNLSLTTKEFKAETLYLETKEKDSPDGSDDELVKTFIKNIITRIFKLIINQCN